MCWAAKRHHRPRPTITIITPSPLQLSLACCASSTSPSTQTGTARRTAQCTAPPIHTRTASAQPAEHPPAADAWRQAAHCPRQRPRQWGGAPAAAAGSQPGKHPGPAACPPSSVSGEGGDVCVRPAGLACPCPLPPRPINHCAPARPPLPPPPAPPNPCPTHLQRL